MKRIYNLIALVAVTFLCSVSAFGQQNLRTAYFLDGYTYKYKMNPAIASERAFIAMPVIGNTGIGIESNMSLSNFLYPTGNGNLTTFLSNSVADDQFLNGLNNLNKLNLNINESIIATGFRVGESFHTIDLSVKADAGAVIPKGLFAFIKSGSANNVTTWDISNIGIRANARMELAYGYSRPITDWIRVGARVKLLMGMIQADALIDDLNLKMDGQEWAVTAHGEAEFSGPVSFGTVSGSNEVDFDSVEVPEDSEEWNEYMAAPSIGAAIDLGATFDFLDYFTASVSVTDLGFIGWKGTTTAVMSGGKWSFQGFGNIGAGEDENIGDQFEEMGDEMLQMLKMEKTGDNIKKTNMLGATIHAGLEARMPFYERLSFGILGTHRFDGIYSWTEGRVSANVAPLNFLSVAASYALSNYGSSLGGVINIHLPGFNLYAGLDSFLPMLDVTPQMVPVSSMNTNLTFGLTFAFGKAERRYE